MIMSSVVIEDVAVYTNILVWLCRLICHGKHISWRYTKKLLKKQYWNFSFILLLTKKVVYDTHTDLTVCRFCMHKPALNFLWTKRGVLTLYIFMQILLYQACLGPCQILYITGIHIIRVWHLSSPSGSWEMLGDLVSFTCLSTKMTQCLFWKSQVINLIPRVSHLPAP